MSVIIPVLNEENEIARILTAATALLEERGGEWEIIVVDNASTDQTAARAEPFLRAAQVRFLRNEVNRGKGFSIRRGMLEARGEYASCATPTVSRCCLRWPTWRRSLRTSTSWWVRV